ncbi:hypothetical protein [Sanguibacter suaedae]|uniref:DUF2975 domain-containing protein n=1 Tax=Sanguibacter suaedae TaxID=2795737 RepID=A0A934I234_9MICO|nr:hypothetical protein [Sanguibacter suaedae]MBI9113778.1 hypothetical protein [Sanguibacter suaedae]
MTTSEDTEARTPVTHRRGARVLLALMTGAVLVAGGLALAYGLVRMWTLGITGRYLVVFGEGDPRLTLDALPQLLQLTSRDGDTLPLEHLPAGLRVLAASPELTSGIVAFVAALLVVVLVRAIARGDAFGRRPRRALAGLGAVLLGGGVLQGLLDTAAVAAVVSATRSGALRTPEFERVYMGTGIDVPHWPVQTIIVGAVALVLLLAFRAGADLQEETQGVV